MQTRELVVYLPDGSKRHVPLHGRKLTFGRSVENDLPFPDDPALSRRHLLFELNGPDWWVEDLKTTNGTSIDGERLEGRTKLSAGQKISAGGLTLVLDTKQTDDLGVTFVAEPASPLEESEADLRPSTAPGAFHAVVATPAISSSSRMQALLDAGREISSDRPLPELLNVILDLAVTSAGASRGVIMLLDEHGQLTPGAMRGSGFKISDAVRERVMRDKESILILDASQHAILSASTTIQQQRVKSLMAVPLQSDDRAIGLIYVDSPDQMSFFLHEDLTLLTLMANMAAIRIVQTRRG